MITVDQEDFLFEDVVDKPKEKKKETVSHAEKNVKSQNIEVKERVIEEYLLKPKLKYFTRIYIYIALAYTIYSYCGLTDTSMFTEIKHYLLYFGMSFVSALSIILYLQVQTLVFTIFSLSLLILFSKTTMYRSQFRNMGMLIKRSFVIGQINVIGFFLMYLAIITFKLDVQQFAENPFDNKLQVLMLFLFMSIPAFYGFIKYALGTQKQSYVVLFMMTAWSFIGTMVYLLATR